MKTNQGAAILIVVLFFVILSITLLTGVVGPVGFQIRNTADFLNSKQSYSVADAQAENTLYRLNKGKTDAPGVLALLGATATASLVDIGDQKEISVQGTLGEFQRFVKARFRQDTGVAFNYGLQTGIGGLTMTGSSKIVGNVYSNGDVIGSGGPGWASTEITGSVTAANASNPDAHINNISGSAPAYSYSFGSTTASQDFSQSFVIGTTTPVTELTLTLKKTGSPANATVKIVNNASGVPGTTVLMSGVLNSSLVTSLYSDVPVVITTPAALSSGTTYWLVIDVPSANASNYYTIGLNNSVYTNGIVKVGSHGGSWASILPVTSDAYFKLFVGGNTGTISGMKIGTAANGSAWARTVNNVMVNGSLYCQAGTGNNKSCDTTKADPSAAAMPISNGNLDQWIDDATAGGATTTVTIGGSNTRTMGPIKINGNLTVTASGKLYITGPIYVTGNVTVDGSGKIFVDSSLGSASGVIVSDGWVNLGGSGGVYGSGAPNSYVIIATKSTCPVGCGTTPAISVSGSAGSVVVSAPDGTVSFTGSAGVKSVVAKTMTMSGSTEINYDSGLADLDFTSGPSGSWTVDTWKEVPSL